MLERTGPGLLDVPHFVKRPDLQAGQFMRQ